MRTQCEAEQMNAEIADRFGNVSLVLGAASLSQRVTVTAPR
jgi:hypothetical protein